MIKEVAMNEILSNEDERAYEAYYGMEHECPQTDAECEHYDPEKCNSNYCYIKN